MLRNAHGNGETLVALFAKIFVEGHRGILSIQREYNGLENLNTRLSAHREGLQGIFICQGSPSRRLHAEAAIDKRSDSICSQAYGACDIGTMSSAAAAVA